MVKLEVKIDTTFSIQIKYVYSTERQTDFLYIKRKALNNTTFMQLTLRYSAQILISNCDIWLVTHYLWRQLV
jgi:hypothetical protein